jgi:hypothetical protein
MGYDAKNMGLAGFMDVDVWACVRCGYDDRDHVAKRIRKVFNIYYDYEIGGCLGKLLLWLR